MTTARGTPLVLLGLRGSGKSTVGRALAERAGAEATFVDLDDMVRARFGGRSVRSIWAEEGEAAFRQAEAEVLGEVLAAAPDVLALGGGTAMIPAARQQLEAVRGDRVTIVYLRGTAALLADRLEASLGDRPPLLDGADPVGEMASVFTERDPVYRALATVVIDLAPGEAVEEVADRVVRACGRPR